MTLIVVICLSIFCAKIAVFREILTVDEVTTKHGPENALDSPYLSKSVIESAVSLVLVEDGDRRNAMTVSCFSEAAHHPTTLWISVAPTTYSHGLICETGKFSLAILNQNQKSIALNCGTISGRERDKCASLDLYRTPDGFLFLQRALASTACTVRQRIDFEEHTLFVADILHTDLDSRSAHLRHLLLSDLKGQTATHDLAR